MTHRVVVVGGGIAGLTTAFRLLRSGDLGADVTVLEADPVPGGKLRAALVGDLELEAGPDSMLARKPWGVGLCRELGLGDDLVPPATGVTHIWTDVGLLPFPSGPFGISTNPRALWRWQGMSRRGKLRALGDLWRKPRMDEADESLGSLIRRRVGDEACDRLVAPLLGGLFAGDVDRLSLQATFPELAVWERLHGSLIRGARKAAEVAEAKGGTPMFLRLRGGFRRLTDALVGAIGRERVRCGAAVTEIRPEGPRHVVAAGDQEFNADAVVFASPSYVSAGLLGDLAPDAAGVLREIQYLSTGVVLLVYPEGTGPALPDSSGFVVPRGMAAMTAATLVSRKWPDEAFGDRAVVRCFFGGAGAEDLLDEADDDIVEGVCRQLATGLPVPAEPEAARVVRWPRAMPQYEVGHLERVAEMERSLPPGIFVTGQALRGAGIPDCVRAGGEVAAMVRAHLSGEPVPEGERVL